MFARSLHWIWFLFICIYIYFLFLPSFKFALHQFIEYNMQCLELTTNETVFRPQALRTLNDKLTFSLWKFHSDKFIHRDQWIYLHAFSISFLKMATVNSLDWIMLRWSCYALVVLSYWRTWFRIERKFLNEAHRQKKTIFTQMFYLYRFNWANLFRYRRVERNRL